MGVECFYHTHTLRHDTRLLTESPQEDNRRVKGHSDECLDVYVIDERTQQKVEGGTAQKE